MKHIQIKRKLFKRIRTIYRHKHAAKFKSNAVKIPSTFTFEKPDFVVVSFTSWTEKIWLCAGIFKQMLSQTILPDKIILNLAIEEFPNKEADLPKDLLEIVNANVDRCEIFWVEKNTKAYKKIIPTMERFPDAVVISADDDGNYPTHFVETMLKYWCFHGKSCPIACMSKGTKNHTGIGCLVKKEYFGRYLDDAYANLILKVGVDKLPFSDMLYTKCILANGLQYKHCNISSDSIKSKHYRYSDFNLTNKKSNKQKQQFRHNVRCMSRMLEEYFSKVVTK